MPGDLIERTAKAAYERYVKTRPQIRRVWGDLPAADRREWIEVQTAALAAAREPTAEARGTRGLLHTLTDDQRQSIRVYDGPENHGDPAFLLRVAPIPMSEAEDG